MIKLFFKILNLFRIFICVIIFIVLFFIFKFLLVLLIVMIVVYGVCLCGFCSVFCKKIFFDWKIFLICMFIFILL